jgi:hypothetical protein
MKKKNLIFTMFALIVMTTSCGPRRYGCGPRRCEVKTQKQPTVPQTLEKNTGRVV